MARKRLLDSGILRALWLAGLLTLLALPGYGQLRSFHRVMSAGDPSMGQCAAPTQDGGFVTVNQKLGINPFTGGEDIDLVATRFDSEGLPVFSKQVTMLFEAQSVDESPRSVLQTPDGGFIVTGYSDRRNDAGELVGRHMFVARLDNQLNLTFSNFLNSTGGFEARKIVHNTDDNSYTIFFSVGIQAGNQVVSRVGAVNLNGDDLTENWTRVYNSATASNEVAMDAAYSNGTYVVTGFTSAVDTGDPFLMWIDADGTFVRANVYNDARVGRAYGLAQAPDGTWALAGLSNTNGGLQGLALHVDADGQRLNGWTIGSGVSSEFHSCQFDQAGNLLAFGYDTSAAGQNYDVFAASVSVRRGALNWANTYGGTETERLGFVSGLDLGKAITVAGDHFLWSGQTASFTNSQADVHTFIIDANGQSGCFQNPMGGIRPIDWQSETIPVEFETLRLTLNPSAPLGLAGPFVFDIAELCQTDCNIIFTIESRSPSCPNDEDGFILVSGTLGQDALYTLFLDDNIQDQLAEGVFENLGGGDYRIEIEYGRGCRAEFRRTLETPVPIRVSADVVNATGPDQADGAIVVNAQGGSEPYTYSLNGSEPTPNNLFSDLLPGAYVIEVTDANGCTETTEVVVGEGVGCAVEAIVIPVPPTCFGGSNGEIAVVPSTGKGPYTYTLTSFVFQDEATVDGSHSFQNLSAGDYNVSIVDAEGCTFDTTFTLENPAQIIVERSQLVQIPGCDTATGSFYVVVSGGIEPYAYTLVMNGDTMLTQPDSLFENLAAGVYVVVITDANGCATETEFVLQSETDLRPVALESISPRCFGDDGGSIFVVATGGQLPYTYQLNDGEPQEVGLFERLTAGSYRLTITDAVGCTYVNTIVLEEPEEIRVALQATNVRCFGEGNGSIEITATGGDGPYTYSIDDANYQTENVIGNLSGGNYSVYVRDTNNCTVLERVEVLEPAALVIESVQTTPTPCGEEAGVIRILAAGGTGELQYSLDGENFFPLNEFRALPAGTYSVGVMDQNGCVTIAEATVEQEGGLQVEVVESTQPSCPGRADGSITAQATTGAEPFEYSIDGENFQASGQFNDLIAGAYVIIARDNNGCVGSIEFNLEAPQSITLNLQSSAPGCGLTDGQIIATAEGGSFPYSYELILDEETVARTDDGIFGDLGAGVYTVVVTDGQGCTNSQEASLLNSVDYDITVQSSPARCAGEASGTVFVGVAGPGTFTYSLASREFQAEPLFDGVGAGRYTVTVRDANGCTDTASVVVDEPAAIVFSARASNPSCGANDGSIELQVTGGTSPLSFAVTRAGVEPRPNDFTANRQYTSLGGGSYDVYTRDANGCTTVNNIVLQASEAVTISDIQTVDSDCDASNGRIVITATGGGGPLRYSIDGGGSSQTDNVFAGLPGGTYEVVVSDGGDCADSRSVRLINVIDLDISLAPQAPACQNPGTGSVRVTATGGAEPYEYSLDGENFQPGDEFTGLFTGPIRVYVRDASMCVDSQTGDIPAAGGIDIQPQVTRPTCAQIENGRIVINATGGTSPYSFRLDGRGDYQIGNSFNNLPAGDRLVEVRDGAGCEASMIVNLAPMGTLTITDIQSQAPGCSSQDGSITVTAESSAGGLRYSIDGGDFGDSNVFEGLGQRTYRIGVTDAAGCSDFRDYALQGVADFDVEFDVTPVSCTSPFSGVVRVNATGGSGIFTYSADGITFIGTNVYRSLAAGSYRFYVRDDAGCTGEFTVEVPAFVPVEATAEIVRRPGCNGTPESGVIRVNATGGAGEYEYSIDGGRTYVAENVFDSLAAGAYVFRVRDVNGCMAQTMPEVGLESGRPVLLLGWVPQFPTCGNADGRLELLVNDLGGELIYEFSADGGANWQSSNVIENMVGAVYRGVIRNQDGCRFDTTFYFPGMGTFQVNADVVNVSCNGGSDGQVTLSSPDAQGELFYQIVGVSASRNPVFENLTAGTYTAYITEIERVCIAFTEVTVGEPDPIELSFTTREATCPGREDGGFTVTASGGVGPYEYAVGDNDFNAGNVFNNIPGQTYLVRVRDENGCIAESSVDVPAGPGVDVPEVFVVQPRCTGVDNGRARIIALGGVRPYEYSLDGVSFQSSSIFRDLAPGEYTAHVRDARGCGVTEPQSFTLTPEIEDFITSIDVEQTSCDSSSKSSIRVNADGPRLQYAINDGPFSQSNSFVDLEPGTYVVSVRSDIGCLSTREVVIDTLSPIMLTEVVPMSPRCWNSNDGMVRVEATTGDGMALSYSIDGVNYQDSNVIEGLAPGSYLVRVRNSAGCQADAEVIIVAPDELSISQVRVRQPACSGGADGAIQVVATGGTGELTYSINGGLFQVQPNFAELLPATYMVTVRDANGCEAVAEARVTSVAAFGVTILRVNANNASGDNGRIDVRVTGAAGPFGYALNGGEFGSEPFFTGLTPGEYVVSVRDGNGCVATRVVVIQLDPRTVCEAPANLMAGEVTGRTVRLTWDGVAGAQGYTVRWRVKNGPEWREMRSMTNSAQVTGLTPETEYDFQVRTECGEDNSSPWSLPATSATDVPCGTPLAVEFDAESNRITLTWNQVEAASRYQIAWRAAGTGWTTATLPTDATRYTVEGLNPDTEYTIRIRALCGDQISSWTRFYTARTAAGRMAAVSSSDMGLSVYPNPNRGRFAVSVETPSESAAVFTVSDLSGRTLLRFEQTLTAGRNEVPVTLEGVAAGVYSLRVSVGGFVQTQKIIVE